MNGETMANKENTSANATMQALIDDANFINGIVQVEIPAYQ